jgi:Protein of unknown function (DUF1566)
MMNRVGIALSLFLLFPGLCLSSPVWAQSSASLLVTTDTDCDWKLDGQSQGRLNVDDAKAVKVSLGQHLVQATSTDGKDTWKTIVTLEQDGQKILQVTLKTTRQQRLDQEEAVQPWTDPAARLMWTRRSNGSNFDWNQASDYCANLQLGGFSAWRLPTIDELQTIDDESKADDSQVKRNLQLPIWAWSSSQGDNPDTAWVFLFNEHRRYAVIHGNRNFPQLRVLCIRRP